MDQQQPGYTYDENSRTYTSLTNVPLSTNNEIPHEQQIVYYNPPVNYQPFINPQPYQYQQQVVNDQFVNNLPALNLPAQQYHHQQQTVSMIHSNTNQQQVFSSYQPVVKITAPSRSSMTNPTGSSTPITAQNMRGRNDISGVLDSNVQQHRPQYPQTTRIFNNNNMPNKRRQGTNQRGEEDIYLDQYEQNYPIHDDNVPNEQQFSAASRRFASTRYPFAPFTVIFTQDVREKVVVDDLIKHAQVNSSFELQTIAYRRGRSEDNQIRILIFVENAESFSFLYNHSNWPTTLAGCQFTMKTPSIPPQLSLVLPIVSLQIEWNDFVQELKDKYPDIANIIRLKNRAQQPVRAVKLELLSAKIRNEILAAGEIPVMHMKLRVVEYFSQANVLICSNCYAIGHFRKNCPQKDEATCKTCGEKCSKLIDHQCSGVLQCIHCGGPHVSNDTKCKVVKDYRAALTRNLLANIASKNEEGSNSGPAHKNITTSIPSTSGQSYANATQMTPLNSNEIIFKKLDAILIKVEDESSATRLAFNELREEMRNRYEETKQQVVVLENKVINMEKRYDEFCMRTLTMLQNMCTSLWDPIGSQSANWKGYWQEQVKTLSDYRSSLANVT
jgi:hypothetical protein